MNIAIALGSRANFGSLRAAMLALRKRGAVVRPVLFASALSEQYGDVRGSLKRDGFDTWTSLSCHIEGDVTDMAKVSGLAALEWATYLRNNVVDAVIVCGDRHECLAPAIAAAYANVKLVHTMGGEVSGSIDDKIRDAITALADVHCVATAQAGYRVSDMIGHRPGPHVEREPSWTADLDPNVHITGCPRIDTCRDALETQQGMGTVDVRPNLPIIMVSQHPVTTQTWDENYSEMRATLNAVGTVAQERSLAVELFWPNGDAHTGATHKAIREWLGSEVAEKLTVRTHRAMGPHDYARMMAGCRVLVGNSSSGIREGAWLGTPNVCVGERQRGREHAENSWRIDIRGCDVEMAAGAIAGVIRERVDHGRFAPSELYGDGRSGERVAEAILG